MTAINLIPKSRRQLRRRNCIRRTARFFALCLTLGAMLWIACDRFAPGVARASRADIGSFPR